MPLPYKQLKSGGIKVMTLGLTGEGLPGLMQFFTDTKYLDLTDDEWPAELDRVDPEGRLEAVVVFEVVKVATRVRPDPLREV